MPENPFTRIGPGILGDDEKNHHHEHCGRNSNLYQKIHYHLRLRHGCTFNKAVLAAPIRIHAGRQAATLNRTPQDTRSSSNA
ncbi:hypothetical protein R75461_05997 [Paraburkholderia nemoris]|jgi:hypothetical protein|nr:hypothetical protein R75461_05997 [Paraburkholderia nemoris]CAE6889729.1 hypothetical protein R69749_07537 [Paraburkholderia domus]